MTHETGKDGHSAGVSKEEEAKQPRPTTLLLVRHALKGLPREEFFIQTKTGAKDAKKAKADIERFLQGIGILAD